MQEQRWSGNELVSRLQAFEKELRAAGLSDNTINTYVGRADTFVRWLRGEYSPIGPNSASTTKPTAPTRMGGQILLDELANELDVDQIIRSLAAYAAVTAYDASLNHLYAATEGQVPDLSVDAHRVAVVEWLRGWGCRHLRKSDTVKTSDVLGAWWAEWKPNLPSPSVAITELTLTDLDNIDLAYEGLRTSRAASRSLRDRDVDVLFGPTAAAKTLFVVRPGVCLPWDEPIRLAFGSGEGDGVAYADFVCKAQDAVVSLTSRLGIQVGELPAKLHRPNSTPAKIVDEYLWVKITRGL